MTECSIILLKGIGFSNTDTTTIMISTYVFCIFWYIFIQFSVSGSYFGRDWSVWIKAKRIIEIEISEGRALGIHSSTELKNFDLFTYGLNFQINSIYMFGLGQNMADFNLITGQGVTLQNDSLQKVEFEIYMPLRQINTCGFIINSFKDNTTDNLSLVKIYWKNDLSNDYDIISRPDNGELFYKLNLKNEHNSTVFIFDTVPSKYFKFELFTKSGKPVRLKIASINKCTYKGKHILTDCGETMKNNRKFQFEKFGVPISIKCPVDCIRTWPCWGFKIYSTDSPICWTAQQNFGQWGNGEYTIYKIKNILFFRDELNPMLNHGIYCRKSITKSPGYTFDRKYYDFAIKEANEIDSLNI